MARFVFIGGIGSSEAQVDAVAGVLSKRYEANVIGVPFGEAQKDLAFLAKLVQDSTVVTHAAGLVTLKYTSPKEVIAIAPPMPTHPMVLLLRTVRSMTHLVKSASASDERRFKVRQYQIKALREHLLRPRYNSFHMRQVSGFNAAIASVALVQNGCAVTLGFMDGDLLFPRAGEHAHVDMAMRSGVIVHKSLTGHRDDFLLDPDEVLDQLRR